MNLLDLTPIERLTIVAIAVCTILIFASTCYAVKQCTNHGGYYVQKGNHLETRLRDGLPHTEVVPDYACIGAK